MASHSCNGRVASWRRDIASPLEALSRNPEPTRINMVTAIRRTLDHD